MNDQEKKQLREHLLTEINKSDFIDNRLTSNTHLRKRHLKTSDEQHVHRISDTKQTNHSSSFPTEETMQREIRECLKNRSNLGKLIDWLNSDKKELNLTNTSKTNAIGSGIEINSRTKRLTEYTAKTTEVRLMKDPSKPDGFAIVTAFPVLTRDVTPTGRDVSHLIKDTKLYQKASKIEQVGMDIANDPLFNPKTMDIQTTKDKIRLREQPCESEITYGTVTYRPDETQVQNTRPNLYQLAKSAAKKLGVKIQNVMSKEQPTNKTQIKEPVQTQPNPTAQSKTIPQDDQTVNVDRIRPDKPKPSRYEQTIAEFGSALEKFENAKKTDDLSLR